MCDEVVFKEFFMLNYCFTKCKTQEMCEKTNNDCLSALNVLPDWFVTNAIPEKFGNAVVSNDDMVFDDENYYIVTLFRGNIVL